MTIYGKVLHDPRGLGSIDAAEVVLRDWRNTGAGSIENLIHIYWLAIV